MSDIRIVEVSTKAQLKAFVDFPNKLYKDAPNFVPSTFSDDMSDWDEKANPGFEYSEAKPFLAYRGDEIVGRIGLILSHKANEKFNQKRVRFSQVDFIDDMEVSAALFKTVEDWAKAHDCNEVIGPMGFSDLDKEGMLVEGFDRESLFFTYYNYPYYIDHLTALGYVKEVDWIEYRLSVPEAGSEQALRLEKLANFVARHEKLHFHNVKSRLELRPLVRSVFQLANEAYAPLFGTVEFTDKQIARYADKFIPLIDPNFTVFVMNENNEMVGFGVTAPSLSQAFKKSKGRLFPTGWIHVLHDLKVNDTLNLFLIAVRPELQKKGINAMLMYKILQNCNKAGIKYAETGPMLEKNEKILAQWKSFDKEQHKRRRCFVKKLED